MGIDLLEVVLRDVENMNIAMVDQNGPFADFDHFFFLKLGKKSAELSTRHSRHIQKQIW